MATTDKKKSAESRLSGTGRSSFPLTKTNFIMMAISALLIVVGFLLMLGPGSSVEGFNPDIFSARRIVVGPTIALIGFVAMGFAIMWKNRKSHKE